MVGGLVKSQVVSFKTMAQKPLHPFDLLLLRNGNGLFAKLADGQLFPLDLVEIQSELLNLAAQGLVLILQLLAKLAFSRLLLIAGRTPVFLGRLAHQSFVLDPSLQSVRPLHLASELAFDFPDPRILESRGYF